MIKSLKTLYILFLCNDFKTYQQIFLRTNRYSMDWNTNVIKMKHQLTFSSVKREFVLEAGKEKK